MILEEKDIDFSKLDWKTFEELCFDLLLKYQFHSLMWRQGGADSGRDIEAQFTVTNPLMIDYPEKWFIECKHHEKGIHVKHISDKIDWALAEKVNHFLVITSSYLTQPTRTWLEKRTEGHTLRVHELNGKLLKQRLLAFPDLVIKYFFSAKGMVVSEMLRLFVMFDVLPDAKSFYSTVTNAELGKLKPEQLIFLLYCQHILRDELERYYYDTDKPELDDEALLAEIAHSLASSKFKFSKELLEDLGAAPHFSGISSAYNPNSDKKKFFVRLRYKGYLLEVYFIRQNQEMECNGSLRKLKK